MSFPPFAWAPSPARTILLWDYAGSAPIGWRPTAMPLRWPDKRAAEVPDHALDASALLAPGDTIATFAVVPAGLVMSAVVVLGGRLVVWLSGL